MPEPVAPVGLSHPGFSPTGLLWIIKPLDKMPDGRIQGRLQK